MSGRGVRPGLVVLALAPLRFAMDGGTFDLATTLSAQTRTIEQRIVVEVLVGVVVGRRVVPILLRFVVESTIEVVIEVVHEPTFVIPDPISHAGNLA